MSKIRIAQVITRLDWGGSPDIYRILCTHLDPSAYDITLITGPTSRPTTKTEEFLKRFHSRTITVPSLKRDINPFADTAALIGLYRIFRRERFDIVHTHTAKAGALGRLAAEMARVPVIVHTPHGHNFYGYFGRLASSAIVIIERFLAHFADAIIALTELERSDYLRFYIAPAAKISVIYQGLELDKMVLDRNEAARLKTALGVKPEGPVVGMVGRLEPVKGSVFFIEAAARILERFPAARFLISGEGSLRPEMERRARELGIGGDVIFAGWREDIPAVLSALDIMVQPSLNEAVGMALIEAQAQGVPVVATAVGGIPEAVRDGRTGILVPPSDAAAVADAVISLLADNKKRAEMGAAGKEWVRDRFMAGTMAEKTSALYMGLLSKKRFFIA